MRHSLILAVSILLGFLAIGVLWQPASTAETRAGTGTAESRAGAGRIGIRVRRISDTWFVLVDSMTGAAGGERPAHTNGIVWAAPVK